MRILNLTMTSLLVGAVLTIPAMADDKIVLGGSATSVYFCSTGNGLVTVAASAFGNTTTCTGESAGSVGGSATFQSPSGTTLFSGTYSIGFPVPPLVIGPVNGFGHFPGNGVTSSFSFNGGAAGSLAGTISWNFVVDHTANPRFDGNLLLSSVSGTNPNFVGDYPLGSTVHVDFTMDTLPTFLDALATNGGFESNTISSGEVIAAPEVSSVLLLGTGMLLAGTFIRYRRRQQS